MPLVDLDNGVWNVVTTTTADTVFHNRSERPIWVTTEDTTSLPVDEGLELEAGEAVVIGVGMDVEASCIGADNEIFYMPLTAAS